MLSAWVLTLVMAIQPGENPAKIFDAEPAFAVSECRATVGLATASVGPSVEASGKVLATSVVLVADDFVVEIYHNGVKVPDEKRTMTDEAFGATAERVDVTVREGDWLVFNVVNNRMRWGGVKYFAAAGLNDVDEPRVGFVSKDDGRWSACDELMLVPRFIAEANYLSDQSAEVIESRWDGGDPRMNARVDGWKGDPLWGKSRNTWIKYRAPGRD